MLSYIVEQPHAIQVKLTFLVSDLGHEEEIYGVAVCKFRSSELEQKELKFKNVLIKNDYSVNLGVVSLEVFKGFVSKNMPRHPQEQEKKSIG